MAIVQRSHDSSHDDAGNATSIARITDYIIIDTVVGGISGKNAQSTSSGTLGESAVIEILTGSEINIIGNLPTGVMLQKTFDNWSASQIGVLDDEVFYLSYNGAKIKNNKVFPYTGFKMQESIDKVYVRLQEDSEDVEFYW